MDGTRQRAVQRLAIGAALILAAGLGGTAEAPKPCCFTNERFAGVCEVMPGDDESCDGILTYLNTPNSTGKTYCGATAIRGGWARVKCTEAATATATGAAAVPSSAPDDGRLQRRR